MPIRIPTQSVIVQRNGSNYVPPVGKPFNFTADEVAEVNALAPDALRKPVNEEVEGEQQTTASKTPTATTAAAKTGGKGKGATSADDAL